MSKRTHRAGSRSSRALSPAPCPGDTEGDAEGRRPHRLEHNLLEQLQSLVRDEASDPALGGLSLVSLRLSVDGSHARVAYAVEAPLRHAARVERSSTQALGRATGFLRARLAELLDLKRLPTLKFTFVGVQEPGDLPAGVEGGEPWHA